MNTQRTLRIDTNAKYLGLDLGVLMGNAGEKIAEYITKNYSLDSSIGILCGKGQNGGDGFATALYLERLGVENITVYIFNKTSDIKSKESLGFLEKIKEKKVRILENTKPNKIDKHDIYIEALVGTGIQGNLKKKYKDVIIKMRNQNGVKIAIDSAVPHYKPDVYLSLDYPKHEKAVVLDIQIPIEADIYCGPGDVKLLNTPKADTYKSQNGQLLIYGGSPKYSGALLLTTNMALKMCGRVFVYTSDKNAKIIESLKINAPECVLVDDFELENTIEKVDAMVIGPGLEENIVSYSLIQTILKKYPDKPCVLDAFGISPASELTKLPNKILTPHRGEVQYIFKSSGKTKNLDGKLKRFAVEHGCNIILKGHTDILFFADGTNAFNSTGNQGMAKAGTGDVLAGLLGGLLTQNSIDKAMRAAIFVAGLAGDQLLSEVEFNYSASDLITKIPKTLKWAQDF